MEIRRFLKIFYGLGVKFQSLSCVYKQFKFKGRVSGRNWCFSLTHSLSHIQSWAKYLKYQVLEILFSTSSI